MHSLQAPQLNMCEETSTFSPQTIPPSKYPYYYPLFTQALNLEALELISLYCFIPTTSVLVHALIISYLEL